MHQPLRSLRLILPPDPFRLPVAHLHHSRRMTQTDLFPTDPAHPFLPLQLSHTHPYPSQPTAPCRLRLGDIFNVVSWGHYQSGATDLVAVAPIVLIVYCTALSIFTPSPHSWHTNARISENRGKTFNAPG